MPMSQNQKTNFLIMLKKFLEKMKICISKIKVLNAQTHLKRPLKNRKIILHIADQEENQKCYNYSCSVKLIRWTYQHIRKQKKVCYK